MRRPEKARFVADPPLAEDVSARAVAHASARALAIGLALSVGLRLAGALMPGAWAWGADFARFLAPAVAGSLLVLGCAGLVLASGRIPMGGVGRLPLRPTTLGIALALATAIACWGLPDQLRFTGDFAFRQGAVGLHADAASTLPQALPLDVWLHLRVPAALSADPERTHVDAREAARRIGAADAALWGLAAAALAWGLEVDGLAALAVSAIGLFGGALLLFTGYGKAFAELSIVTLAAGACAARVARDGGGLLGLAGFTSLGLLLHRSGLALLPVWAVAIAVSARRDGAWTRSRRVTLALAAALPIVTLAITAPTIFAAMRVLDARHLAPPGTTRFGWWAITFAPSRLRDLLNALLVVCPLVAALPFLLVASRAWRGARAALLAALALPALALILFVHPLQGSFRDLDVVAPSGVALSVAVAWLAADALRGPGRAGLALGAACIAAALGLAPLLHLNDAVRGTARIESWLAGPPAPDPSEAAGVYDYLGMRALGTGRYADAAREYERAVSLAPNPRFFVQWGVAATLLGDHPRAHQLFTRATELNPDLTLAWLGLGTSSTWLGDTGGVRRAVVELRRLEPGHPQLPGLEEYLRGRGAHVP